MEVIKEFSDRFSFSKTFIGSSVLAIGTSFPELINAITAGIGTHSNTGGSSEFWALNSFYNLTGANILQNVFVGCVLVGFGIRAYFQNKKSEYHLFNKSVFDNKYLLWILIVSETFILLVLLIFKSAFKHIEIFGVNPIPFLFVVVWISYFCYSFKQKKEESLLLIDSDTLGSPVASDSRHPTHKKWLSQLSKKQFLLVGALCWAIFAVLSFLNFLIVSSLTVQLNIPKNIALGFILGLITSIPEFSSFFFLFRNKEYSLATAGLFGSSLFNLCLPLITNVISGKWVFSDSQFDPHTQKVFVWMLSDLLISLLLFSATFRVKEGYINRPFIASVCLVAVCVGTNVLVTFL